MDLVSLTQFFLPQEVKKTHKRKIQKWEYFLEQSLYGKIVCHRFHCFFDFSVLFLVLFLRLFLLLLLLWLICSLPEKLKCSDWVRSTVAGWFNQSLTLTPSVAQVIIMTTIVMVGYWLVVWVYRGGWLRCQRNWFTFPLPLPLFVLFIKVQKPTLTPMPV